MPDVAFVLKGILPPIAAALLLVGLGGARWLPLAVALGVHVAFGWIFRWPRWPHELWLEPDGRDWLVWGVVAAALVALLERLRALRGRAAAGAGVAVAAVAVWLVLSKQAARWPADQVLLHVGLGGLAVALLVPLGRTVLARAPAGVGPAVVFTVLLAADSMLLLLGRSALLAQLAGAASAALGAAAATSLWRRPFVLTAADGTWIGAAHGLFVLAGSHLAELGWPATCCGLAAPLLLLVLPRALAPRPSAWAVAALLAMLPLLGLAFWLAARG